MSTAAVAALGGACVATAAIGWVAAMVDAEQRRLTAVAVRVRAASQRWSADR